MCEKYLNNITTYSFLYTAVKYGFLDIVKVLVKKGVNVDEDHEDYGIPIVTAYETGHHDIVKFLLERGNQNPYFMKFYTEFVLKQ